MQRQALFAIGVFILTLLTGCGAKPKLEVINQLETNVCAITTYEEPRKDLLEGDPLFAGNSIRLTVTEGDQDVFLLNCDASNAVIAVKTFEFGASGVTTWIVSESDPAIHVTNSTGADLCSLQIKDHEANDWGPNWLQNTGMAADWDITMIVPAAGSYDLYAKACDDETGYEEYQVQVSGTPAEWVITPD